MTPATKRTVGVTVTVIVLLGIIVLWHVLHKPANPLNDQTGSGSVQNIGDFDQFQQDLAARVLDQMGSGSNFSVIVAAAAYPLGTLLRPTGSIPADFNDCVPTPLPQPFS